MIRIRFAAEDRERYGLPEWIEVDITRPKLSEIRRLKAEVQWDWSQVHNGIDSEDLDEKVAARAVLWWLIVNRHHHVSWEDFDLDILGAEVEAASDPNSSAPAGASTSSERTSRRSRTSSA